jgi:hypothetical protein
MEEAPRTIARPREFLVVSLTGLVLAAIMTWPLASNLGGLGRTLDVDADGQFAIWNVSWVARTIVADPLRLFDANIFHPHKTTLAYSEANVLAGVVGMPAWWLTGNPWLTMNVAMLFAFASAYVGAYLLVRYLTGDSRAAAVCAVLYAFCPYVFSHLSHIQLLMTGGLPLSMLMLHRVADAPSVRRGVGLGLALGGQALACAYYGVFGGLMVGYGALVLAATRRLWTSVAYWKAVAVGAGTSIALVLPFFLPYVRVQAESGFARTMDDAIRYSARAHGYLVSSANAHRWLLDAVRRFGPWEEVLFPGLLAVGLGLAGIVLASRRQSRDREVALLYGTLAVLAVWASFGPAAGLYRVLYYLPTFSFLRAPSRLGLVVVLCLVVFAAIALRHMLAALPSRSAAGAVAALAGIAAVAELTIYPLKWYRAPQVPVAYALLAEQPRAPVAEFPFYGERVAFPLHTQYMLFSTSHWMPLVNGYSDVIPRDFREAAVVLDSFPSNDAFGVLARRRVRYIAIHWDMFGRRQDEIRRRLEPYAANLRVLGGDDRMTLYEVVRYP